MWLKSMLVYDADWMAKKARIASSMTLCAPKKCSGEEFYFAEIIGWTPLIEGHPHLTGKKFVNSPFKSFISVCIPRITYIELEARRMLSSVLSWQCWSPNILINIIMNKYVDMYLSFLEVKLAYELSCSSVGWWVRSCWSVCHNFLKWERTDTSNASVGALIFFLFYYSNIYSSIIELKCLHTIHNCIQTDFFACLIVNKDDSLHANVHTYVSSIQPRLDNKSSSFHPSLRIHVSGCALKNIIKNIEQFLNVYQFNVVFYYSRPTIRMSVSPSIRYES